MRINAYERAVLYLPARTNAIFFEIVPATKILGVEQQLPARRFLRRSEGIDPFIGSDAIKRTDCEQECNE